MNYLVLLCSLEGMDSGTDFEIVLPLNLFEIETGGGSQWGNKIIDFHTVEIIAFLISDFQTL